MRGQHHQTNFIPMKTTIKFAAWNLVEFVPEIIVSSPGIKPDPAQSGPQTRPRTTRQTNSKLMKNKTNKITEVRHLHAEAEHLDHHDENDGVDRRGFLKCMAWAGTGMLWTVSGGVLGSRILSPVNAAENAAGPMGDFSFVQISDSHIGFNKPANTDVVGTLKQAIARINA